MPNPHLRAMLLSLLAFNIWTVGDAAIKFIGLSGMPISNMILPFSVSGMLTVLCVAAWRGKVRTLIPQRLLPETARAVVMTLLCVTNFVAFTRLPMALCYAVIFMAPIPVAIVAAKVLHEKVSWQHYCCMGLGFLGVLLAINPTAIILNDGELWAYIALSFSLVFYVINTLMIRLAGRSSDSTESMAFYPLLVRIFLILPFFIWQFEPLEIWQWLSIFGVGIISSTGWILFSSAMKLAPAAVVSPFQYFQIIGGAILGYLIWYHIPSWNLVLGSIVIIAASLYMARLTHLQEKPQNA